MTFFQRTLPVALCIAAPALLCLSGLAHAAPATCAAVSPVAQRIVQRAEGDVESLRTFVRTMAIVHGVNMVDVRENLDAWRAAVECRKQMAAAEQAARPLAAQDDKAGGVEAPVAVAQR